MQYEVYEKYKYYNAPHCWQYQIRLDNYKNDLEEAGLIEKEVKNLKVSDFEFHYVSKKEKETCKNISKFIEKHEWLGKVNIYPTHRFLATYKGRYAGVIIMSIPNAFSIDILGKEYRDKERLISRGACISWSPKNLNSALLMWSIRWMVKNTKYRIFSAYSDPEAKELGTIYQACNFYYLGQNYGSKYLFFDPKNPQLGWFNDRYFRARSVYKKYAQELGIKWQSGWENKSGLNMKNIPKDIKIRLKQKEKEYIQSCIKREVKLKHKYVYILGKDKKETKYLRNLFKQLHPDLYNLPYPKIRGE